MYAVAVYVETCVTVTRLTAYVVRLFVRLFDRIRELT